MQKFAELTQAEVDVLERGFLTINTLNRIESKQSELMLLFNSMGYWNTDIQPKAWSEDDVFGATDFRQLINGLDTLKTAFFVYEDTPKTPQMAFSYATFNDIEKALFDMDVMINDVKSNYRYCGAIECGEDLK